MKENTVHPQETISPVNWHAQCAVWYALVWSTSNNYVSSFVATMQPSLMSQATVCVRSSEGVVNVLSFIHEVFVLQKKKKSQGNSVIQKWEHILKRQFTPWETLFHSPEWLSQHNILYLYTRLKSVTSHTASLHNHWFIHQLFICWRVTRHFSSHNHANAIFFLDRLLLLI